MSAEIVPLHPSTDVAVRLHQLADDIAAGAYDHTADRTVVLGTHVFYFGEIEASRAAVNAVWDLTYAIHKLMAAGHGGG
jgi:hypothetical protein